jgi:uncharacterized protein YggE
MGDIGRPMPVAMPMMRSEATQSAVPLEAGEIEIRARVTMTVSIK